ncbi:phage tail assembly protein [Comamonas piscis]|uniref:Phage tail assembly protein n=1 Tax=Comamonas piscis TaxID=1562974 RepID=A0A7G5EHX8_9BURK|nr:phage tail assembly protein [Comamonas piscis]QMV73603.1 phage tail assembly protein [Comamonas piscis]WSO32025.1 phage tail assembly protein [Comamonas piscis]
MQTAEQTKQTTAAHTRKSASVTLVQPVVRAGQTIGQVQILKPSVGDLRGLLLVEVLNMKVDALAKLLPRVTVPNLMEAEIFQMDTVDLVSMATEAAIFLTGATVPTESE